MNLLTFESILDKKETLNFATLVTFIFSPSLFQLQCSMFFAYSPVPVKKHPQILSINILSPLQVFLLKALPPKLFIIFLSRTKFKIKNNNLNSLLHSPIIKYARLQSQVDLACQSKFRGYTPEYQLLGRSQTFSA